MTRRQIGKKLLGLGMMLVPLGLFLAAVGFFGGVEGLQKFGIFCAFIVGALASMLTLNWVWRKGVDLLFDDHEPPDKYGDGDRHLIP